VDDKPFFRDMLGPVLLAAGYEVTTSASAREALSLLERGLKIQAAVTDIDMPEMDGYAFARALRKAPGLADLPIVAIAPQATPGVREAAQLCGVQAVVGKFDRRALLDALEKLLDGVAPPADEIERRILSEIAA
ncbi:MAG: response regulator, partial [Methylocystis sp.]|nr:response regulator [Methylocystis sp.]